MTTTAIAPELDSQLDVLAFARRRRKDALRAEADIAVAAVAWATQHPAESIVEAAHWPGGEEAVGLAGPGAPLVAEFCVAEFALAVGLSTDAGRRLIGEALELAHRLPRVWARVQDGSLPVWRARRIAEHTISLGASAAAYVDRQVAPYAHRTGPAATERLVTEAIARFEPERARAEAERAAESRYFRVDHRSVSCQGTTNLDGCLDLADALDLDAALTRGAEQLRLAGCTESLDVRRSMAAGALARGELNLGPATGREVVVYVHVQPDSPVAKVENHQRLALVDQVAGWCREGTVTIKPVIDLNARLQAAGYAVPERIAEQVALRDQTCVFPLCSRPARRCDTDHVLEHNRGGPTASDNLAALCRGHHRLKTHSPWSYRVLGPGDYEWTSPHGQTFVT